AIVLPVVFPRVLERHAAEDRDSVMHALPVELDMGITVAKERIGGKYAVEHLGFLQAQDIGLLLFDQPLDQPDARAHRVDVPRSDLEPFGHAFALSPDTPSSKRPSLRGHGARAGRALSRKGRRR